MHWAPVLTMPVVAEAAARAPAFLATDDVGLRHYLVVSAIVFGFGLLIAITRKSTIAVLMGIELLLNAAGLNFVAFAKYSDLVKDRLDGQVVTLFVIVIAAAEAALALAIALNIFNALNSVELDDAQTLKG